jgi:hypothetical protein
MKHFLIILLLAYQNATTVMPGNYTDPYVLITEGQALLKEGDLVVRLNRDPTSQFIKNFNRHDKSYSHAGIVLFENGYPYIFHIVNGEENPDEKLKKDSLSRFCNPRKNMAYGIFRYEMNAGEIKILKKLIHAWYDSGVRFDSAFNLKTDDRMYCSEMISKALVRATAKRILIETTKLTTPEAKLFSAYTHLPFTYTSNLQIVSIDDLYKNPFCHLIKEYNYEK